MKLSKKSIIAAIASLTCAVVLSGCSGPFTKTAAVGYYKSERIDQEAAQIKALEDEANQKLQDAQMEFLKTVQENPNMTQEEFQQKQQEQMGKMQRLSQSYRMQIRQKVDAALDEICKEKKIDVVMENSTLQKSVLMGGTDITEDLIEKLK
ncbi:MAG: OmpH family outer membrane protein [Selenomonadaceae bacterium]